MLFDPFEEELDLLATAIERGDALKLLDTIAA